MSLLRLRTLLLRRRRRSSALAAVALVAAAIAVHHAAPAVAAMGAHHDGHGDAVAELCLGVLTAAAAAAIAASGLALLTAAGRRLGGRAQSLLPVRGAERATPAPPSPRARAGPFFLCVMRC